MGFFLETIFLIQVSTLFFPDVGASDGTCSSICKCGNDGPVVRFPFRIEGLQQEQSGCQGFDLACNDQNETVLELPFSGKFLVRNIDYSAQTIQIYDPYNCLPKRLLHLNFSGSCFKGIHYENYTFLSCSSKFRDSQFKTLSCLSGSGHKVLAIPSMALARFVITSTCSFITSVLVPILQSMHDHDLSDDDLILTWEAPDHSKLFEAQSRKCKQKNESVETTCSGLQSTGLLSDFGYVAAIGVGVPALLCLVGMICYIYARLKASSGGSHSSTQSTIAVSPETTIMVVGLDELTIASYPTIALGEISRLSNSIDNTCSICLSDYQPNEALKSVPDCNHYFHAVCIDEWLRKRAICPLCRNFDLGGVW